MTRKPSLGLSINSRMIFDCPCAVITEDEVQECVKQLVARKKAAYTVAINAEKLHRFSRNSSLRNIVNDSTLPYPDGAGAVLALRLLHGVRSEKINMPILALQAAYNLGFTIYIVGAEEASHHSAVEKIRSKYPGIKIVGNMHGYNSEAVITRSIQACKPDVILVAMGSPRQEVFAREICGVLPHGLVIGCGGALDIISGRLQRAPSFWIENNLEWLFRLFQEPWRWRRQVFLPAFIVKLFIAAGLVRLSQGLPGKRS